MAKPNSPAPKAVAVARAPQSPLRKVSISARLDGAREVLVSGDFTKWNGAAVPLNRTTDGTWITTLQLAPGEYQYRLLVDGQWRDHAEAPRRVPNPFGTENCVLTVS
jgi:hypothetical protein